jgi:isopenicillin-N epimerase
LSVDRSKVSADLASHWALDPAVIYLNHGSFGACPREVLQAQARLRLEMEREPVDFLDSTLPERLDAARRELAMFLGCDSTGLAFVTNATAGVNAVLRSLRFEPGDELLVTNHTYAACRKTAEFVAARSGARMILARLPFPVGSEAEIIAAVLACVSPRTRLALLDHVTSPTALVLPIARLVRELHARGIETLVDGAHAAGMVPLELEKLGAAYYTGNAHKWLCAPKGAAFLHVRHDRRSAIHPPVISHGYGVGFQAEFDWMGTSDPTAWLCIPESLRFIGSLLPGGWSAVMARNRALALEARRLLLESLGIASPCPEAMIGSMASIPLPAAASGSPAARLDCKGLHAWFRERGIETWLHSEPMPVLRISAQLYNHVDQYQRLAGLLAESLHGS